MGEGDRRRWSRVFASSESVRCGIAEEDAGCETGASSPSLSPSSGSDDEDEDEDEDKDEDGDDLVACGFIKGAASLI